ncbi:sulfite reductase flavoprotein subunit alpha [Mycobacteroides franklinii]|uniref:diflavin oxidoreductase n=1 Tax=Mycobacteroides franklinii TaxID=948102 RepID=UPI0009940433|nr:sulfite reductase flavoprotein subunit alpha [Mycobacteroides franklinii]
MTAQPDFSLIVGYGTDMGNAEDAAMSFCEALEEATGIKSEAVELNQVDIAELQSASHFVVVVSTFGDGEFPDNALLFWEAISADAAGRLEHLNFAVLALGDSSYEFFCNAGLLLDERLHALGATRLTERVDIDGPYLQPSKEWTTDLVKRLSAGHINSAEPVVVAEAPAQPKRERNETVEARLVVNRLLTTAESDKEVRHYEVDLAGSGISYEAGDSIAVHASNDPALVAAILAELRVDAAHRVTGHDEPLGELLSDHLEIRTPSRTLRALVATRTDNADAIAALGGDVNPAPGSWLYGKDVLDLIKLGELTVDDLVDNLRPLQFRDYSIASSPAVHPDTVHLTVATIRYTDADRTYGGVASTFLADRGQAVRVHLRPNHTFRLPAPDVPIIMVGPGTGIAPFRGFLQERQAAGAPGRSWLFFGDRHRATSFLYGEELQGFVDSGTLTRLDLAFSRDGSESDPKQYVQHRMSESAAELFAWLQDGAYLYVCGDADHMAKDVDATLHDIVAHCGGLGADGAHAYVNDLIKSHRYVRDVY